MSVVSLELLKKHVNADDYSVDDELLAAYLESAESAVVRYTHRSIADLTQKGGDHFPVELRQAIMLLAASWYNQRESISSVQMHSVPDSLLSLVKPFRKLS